MIDVCLVGAGFIGPVHAANLVAHSGARAINDLGEALADPAVAAVIAYTPPRTHTAIIEGRPRGKGNLLRETDRLGPGARGGLRRRARKDLSAVRVGFNRRFDPTHRALHDAIRSEEIGPDGCAGDASGMTLGIYCCHLSYNFGVISYYRFGAAHAQPAQLGKPFALRQDQTLRNPSIKNRPRDSLTTQVLRDLAARIERGELKPGDRLPTERELVANYRVSRTVVREAISSLRASGRIETQQGRGAFVRSPPVSFRYTLDVSDLAKVGDVLHIMDLRIGLESEAASLAAKRHSAVQLNDIHAALKKLETDILSADTSVASDVQFHLEIVRATGNAYFVDLFKQLAPVMIPRARVDLFKHDRKAKVQYLQLIQQEHAQIYQAIARRDSEAARAAVRLHLANSRERLRAALDRTAGPDERRAPRLATPHPAGRIPA